MNSLIGFLLDDSGSMKDSRKATIDSFNEFLRVQQYREDDCAFYMAKFSMLYTEMHKFVNIFKVPRLDISQYDANGSDTALWDAIIKLVEAMRQKIDALPDQQRPTNVTLVIQTDGQDGCSWGTTGDARQAVKRAQADGWHILFLAKGSDGFYSAQALGIDPTHIIRYDGTTTARAFAAAAGRVLESVVTGQMGTTPPKLGTE